MRGQVEAAHAAIVGHSGVGESGFAGALGWLAGWLGSLVLAHSWCLPDARLVDFALLGHHAAHFVDRGEFCVECGVMDGSEDW
jgi:hypothetical protein